MNTEQNKKAKLSGQLTCFFVIKAKLQIYSSGFTIEEKCEFLYREFLEYRLNVSLDKHSFDTLKDEKDFLNSPDFLQISMNLEKFVIEWILSVKQNNETTLHEDTFYKIMDWFKAKFCPGFSPIC